jgi:hypothetical protein
VDRWPRKKNLTLASLAKERQAQTAARHQIKNLSNSSMQTLEPFDPLGYSKTAKRQENYLLEAKAALGHSARLPYQASICASGRHREFNLFAFTLTRSNRAYYKRDVSPRDRNRIQ